MRDWPIGLSTGCFYHTSIFDVLKDIRDGGFTLLEVCSSPAHLDFHDHGKVKRAADMLNDYGMQPFSFHAPFAEHIDITSLDRGKREQAVGEIMRAADAAGTLGVLHFVIHPGPEREGKPPAHEYLQHLGYAAEGLTRVAKHCRELGMTLVVENMLPHLLFGHTSDILWIVGAIEETNFATCLDTGHAFLSGDLYSVMYKLTGHLRMIHASDNNGTFDDHLPPGQGSIDWNTFITKLRHTDFSGGIILELAGDPHRRPVEILADARGARSHIDGIRRKVEVGI